jgi:hypothetical protein
MQQGQHSPELQIIDLETQVLLFQIDAACSAAQLIRPVTNAV